ncbi:xanthine dehydrogenase family protein molybdopterin-binding subunit [Hymenobacter sp. YC55]|uniref:xanthine dehydrogenase family protein molybdopterin-binding subunit n=1 Tax=Hymenobacter sp. YC55 TaxID=3034019 RepID=UPI0023F7B866|nr:xanthine dehydrogenase family protein molybdopterin-binding subunit [Hymenobacter sp. YC55]MDF7814859.1 xanthine dehydrogenase family protein molybdopterin-binding subunit [Hymenobacter sp. YC55]
MTSNPIGNREVGRPLDRVDAHLKVTGQARYTAEMPVPHVTHGVLVRSTIARGRITHINTEEVARYPGVLAILTHENAPRMKQPDEFDPSKSEPSAAPTTLVALNTDEVFWHGQPVAVVVAETLDQAQEAAALLQISYEPGAPGRLSLHEEKPRAFVPKKVMGEKPEVKKGDAEAALAAAPYKVDCIYTTPPYNHNPIEAHNTLAYWEGDHLTVYDSSQYITGGQKMLAEMFHLPKGNVRVISAFVGGAFGSKGRAWPHVALTAAAAKVVGRPVKIDLPRKDMFYMVGGRTPSEQRVALGADATGQLTALIHTGITASSTKNTFPEHFSFPARHLYACPNLLIQQQLVRLDMVPNTFMRAPGDALGMNTLEAAMDELAYVLHMDPVELRLRNDTATDPTERVPFSSRHLKECFELGAEKFGWQQRNPEPRSMRDGEWLVGWGTASAYYPANKRQSEVKLMLQADGTVVVQCGTHEMGNGTSTIMTQYVAEQLGLSVQQVRFEYGDTRLPKASGSYGSTTTATVGAALAEACATLKRQLLKLARKDHASPLCYATSAKVDARDGGLFLKAEPTKGESYVTLLTRLGRNSLEVSGQTPSGWYDKLTQAAYSFQSFGAHFCAVRVHQDTGEVQVTRWVGVYDCGRILNTKTANSQFLGSITMGIGMALWENTAWDQRDGRIPNASLSEYHVPAAAGLPHIEAYALDIPDPHMALGAHGAGEIAMTGAAAAVANAVYHATGKRIRDLPITPDKLL